LLRLTFKKAEARDLSHLGNWNDSGTVFFLVIINVHPFIRFCGFWGVPTRLPIVRDGLENGLCHEYEKVPDEARSARNQIFAR
jgi:hypothetical protein